MKVEQQLDIGIKGGRKEEVFMIHLSCSRTTPNISLFCFYAGKTK